LPPGQHVHAAAAVAAAAAAHHAATAQSVSVAAVGSATESASTTAASVMASPLAAYHAAAAAAATGGGALGSVSAATAIAAATRRAAAANTAQAATAADHVAKLDFLRDSASSPVSSDSLEDMEDVDDTTYQEQNSGTVSRSAAACAGPDMLSIDVPAPVALGNGFRKNASLTNLADYDDFMRKITAAVNDRVDHSPMVFEGSSHLSIIMDDTDDLETPVKTEQFEDSLLVDM
jgi:hypothetical protein